MFVTKFVTLITKFVICVSKFVIHVTKFVTKTLLCERKNFLADSKNYLADNENYLADNENYLADSGVRNGLPGAGAVKKVCRKVNGRPISGQDICIKTYLFLLIFAKINKKSRIISLFNKAKSPNPAYSHYL